MDEYSIMDRNCEVIALLLDESADGPSQDCPRAQGAQRLIRDREGRVCLEAIETQQEFDETARITGCFRRGKAIRDPRTREIIGYEMEEVAAIGIAVGL